MRLAAIIIFCLAVPAIGFSATLLVPSQFPTIQGAITAAVNGDTVLVSPGTYVENIDFLGKAITVISDKGAEVTIIDGGSPVNPDFGSVVTFQSGEGPSSVLEGFTITNGSGTKGAYPNGPKYSGGGIFIKKQSSPTITKNIITKNYTNQAAPGMGGGILCKNGTPIIVDNIISENDSFYSTGDGWGGGITCYSADATIENNIIEKNSSNWGGGIFIRASSPNITKNLIHDNSTDRSGAGIYAWTSFSTIQNNIISNNSAGWSGGIQMEQSAPIVKDNIFSGNSALNYCGGVRCYQCAATVENNIIIYNSAAAGGGGLHFYDANPTIRNNFVAWNTSDTGGGIRCDQSTPMISNNTFAGNTADVEGGGLWCRASTFTVANNLFYSNTAILGGGIDVWQNSVLTITNNTLLENSADSGGAIACRRDSTTIISDSILWNNEASSGKEIYIETQANPSSVTIDFCDLEGGQASVHVDPSCNLVWGGNMIDADPLFHIGPKGFHYLSQIAAGQLANSPCVDTGSTLATIPGMDVYWTRTDEVVDSGMVDMGFHYGGFAFPSLQADTFAISESAGGEANLLLLADSANANRNYIMLGSVTGTDPGTPLPGGQATLPLNWDIFTNLVLSLMYTPVFSNFMGTLDPAGRAEAQFNTLGPFTGGAGLTLYFAYALNGPWDFASIPVSVDITP